MWNYFDSTPYYSPPGSQFGLDDGLNLTQNTSNWKSVVSDVASPTASGGHSGRESISVSDSVPDWLKKYPEDAAGEFGTSFLTGVQDALKKLEGASPMSGYIYGTGGTGDQVNYPGGQNAPAVMGAEGGIAGSLMESFNKLQGAPDLIEQLRVGLPAQFMAGLQPMQEYYQPALESMSDRGILPSSVTGTALADVQSEINRNYGAEVAGANNWAATSNLEFLESMPQITAQVAGTLTDIDRAWLAQVLGAGGMGQAGQSSLNQILGIGQGNAQMENSMWAQILPLLLGG